MTAPADAPLVSVVIPTVLRPRLARAVAHARGQEVPGRVEVVVAVDTVPGDDELRAVSELADTVVLTGGRRGAGTARNLGVEASTAPYVAFLDDDDEWHPGHLAAAIAALDDPADPADVVGARVTQVLSGGVASGPVPRDLLPPGDDVLEYLFRGRRPDIARPSIYTSTLVARRETAVATPWRAGLRRHQDWEWLRAVQASGGTVRQSPHPGARIHMGSAGSISGTADWESSLAWGRTWRGSRSPRVYADFVAGQPLRYATQSRSLPGVLACLREVASARALPSPQTLVLGLGGLVPRDRALRVLARLRPGRPGDADRGPRDAGSGRPAAAATRRPRVLLSAGRPGASGNPYVELLGEAMRSQVDVEYFSWRAALLWPYDVLHVHWPDHLTRGAGAVRTAGKRALFALLLARLALRRTTVVRTVHNLRPHEEGSATERRLHDALDRLTRSSIHLVPHDGAGGAPAGADEAVVPHGHYRDVYPPAAPLDAPTGNVLYFGSVRPYKGVPRLCEQFRAVERDDLRLRVVGRPMDDAMAREVAAAAAGHPRIDLDLRGQSVDELARAIDEATLVVLPFDEMHNSGSVLLALSLDRPVLVPESPTSSLLRDEVGAAWVHTYAGPLTGEHVGHAYDEVARRAAAGGLGRVEFRGREWAEIAAAHVDVFRRSAGRGGSRDRGTA